MCGSVLCIVIPCPLDVEKEKGMITLDGHGSFDCCCYVRVSIYGQEGR